MNLRLFFLIMVGLLSFNIFALDYSLEMNSMPNMEDMKKIKALKGQVEIRICCAYPSAEEMRPALKSNIKMIHVTAGHLPYATELAVLEKSGIEYKITAEESFPQTQDIAILNKSRVSQVIVTGKDFPTHGEIMAYNQFTIPFRLEILKKEFPTYEHMLVIRLIKKEHSVAFHNPIPPGPGYANFFNSLLAHKIFVITDKFPYGDDAIGLNMLTNSSVEIRPLDRLMPQDLPVINQIQLQTLVSLNTHWPVDAQYFDMLAQIKSQAIELKNDGSLSEHVDALSQIAQNGQKKMTFTEEWR